MNAANLKNLNLEDNLLLFGFLCIILRGRAFQLLRPAIELLYLFPVVTALPPPLHTKGTTNPGGQHYHLAQRIKQHIDICWKV